MAATTTRESIASQQVIGASTSSRMVASRTLTMACFGQRSRSSIITHSRSGRRQPSSLSWHCSVRSRSYRYCTSVLTLPMKPRLSAMSARPDVFFASSKSTSPCERRRRSASPGRARRARPAASREAVEGRRLAAGAGTLPRPRSHRDHQRCSCRTRQLRRWHPGPLCGTRTPGAAARRQSTAQWRSRGRTLWRARCRPGAGAMRSVASAACFWANRRAALSRTNWRAARSRAQCSRGARARHSCRAAPPPYRRAL
eukprot:scaffold8836_cov62-Phaeocystis_antarctica.AAC.4